MAKRRYKTWSSDDMEKALSAYKDGSLKFNETCRVFNIPKPTFRRHLKGLNMHEGIGRPKYLTKAMEDELVNHILELESRFFGVTIRDLRHLAYQLAEKYGLPHKFNPETKLAGWKWYYKFLKTHPQISLRTPEPTCMARCKGFNKKTVMEFFDKYEALLDEGKFTAQQIYNVDETGLSTVHKPQKVLALKGKHQVGAVTSGDRGLNTTCICCMNAAGEFIPPMLIFKRKRMTDDLKRGGPPNTVYTCSESGWITSELFVDWLKHFIKSVKLQISKEKTGSSHFRWAFHAY
ncbi:jerky protein homolog-like [Trichoplusia ni]|uniref:Jerky protein homolog-like n=1 Tax=Trichoplusia ni TaxID=7111 RepID=A0A7E5X1N8_TRINI|nr:jerky protein homolog-like [Trichoplusia ni]